MEMYQLGTKVHVPVEDISYGFITTVILCVIKKKVSLLVIEGEGSTQAESEKQTQQQHSSRHRQEVHGSCHELG